MATLAQSVWESTRPSRWLWEFLKEELEPYPGRAGTVARMVIAATLVMIICMTFRIPYGFLGAIYALLISRESPRATLQSGGATFLVTGIAAAYLLISVWFVISVPILHFLWVIGSFFLAFFALSIVSNYGVASIFAIIISFGVPLWDRHTSAETNVEDTLRLTLAASVGLAVTAAVELAFARIRPGDDIVLPIAERLAAVQSLLACHAEGRSIDPATEKKVIGLGMVGTSTLRRTLRRSDYSPQYGAPMSGVVALVSRLVDITATLTQLSFEPSGADQTRFRNLAATVASIRTDLVNRRIPNPIQFEADDEPSRGVPLLREMENIVTLIPQAFAGSPSSDEYLPSPSDDARRSELIAADAFVNSEHIQFALKGCLAASVCYITYNAIAWPGISTAVTTCLLTALSTIGASRQKQVLRLAGALVGGFLIGMGSQIFILPYLDSITGFTVLFILLTALASWVMTSSPRLSYFGVQAALAFYLINVQEFAIQASLSVARDRVVGILLGLFMMWLVFDQLWSARAGVEMKRAFISTLRLLAQLAREPVSRDIRAAIKRDDALRETINAHFDTVRSLADGVLFEFGPSRQQDLALRDRIRRWQPQLRTLFLMRNASLKYRLQLPGFELPEAVRLSQQAYDDHSAGMVEDMADRIEGNAPQVGRMSADSFELLEQMLQAYGTEEPQQLPAVRSFVTLLRGIDGLTTSLAEEIATEFDRTKLNIAS
jgi:multidrug resistance protein MdtO